LVVLRLLVRRTALSGAKDTDPSEDETERTAVHIVRASLLWIPLQKTCTKAASGGEHGKT